jgi:ABC-type cobalamin/Fe3+-siderophores transport system ATPase subunit
VSIDAPRVVGRSREDALLAGAVARVADGAVCVEVVGEAGIGKTTMLGRLADLASRRGSIVLGGRGSEFERDLDFGLFVDALDAHLGNLDDRRARNLEPDVVAELAAIFPSLRSRSRDHRPLASVNERFRASGRA